VNASRVIAVALASIAATAAFILSCNKGPGPANAQSCAAWEVSVLDLTENCGAANVTPRYPTTCVVPVGWEPVGNMPVFNNSEVLVRRCAP